MNIYANLPEARIRDPEASRHALPGVHPVTIQTADTLQLNDLRVRIE
jgi:hypothetical protein